MVDAVGSFAASSRYNPFDPPPAFEARSSGESELADATNGVRATRVNGVEVILTQAERASEELTYENLRPTAFDRSTENPSEDASAADSVLNESFAAEPG